MRNAKEIADLEQAVAAPGEFSVILRAKNAEAHIGSVLQALFAQTRRSFELIVVDSGSTDRTLDIVSDYPCRLIQIEAHEYYPGPVLNRAAAAAKGEFLVFINSDAILQSSTALEELLAPFEDSDVQATYARQVPRAEAYTWVRNDYEQAFPERGREPKVPFSLCTAAMRRAIWEERPFYSWAWASEDAEWASWARANGHVIHYTPGAVVEHSHNYGLAEIYGRQFVEGEADSLIHGGTPPGLRVLRRFATSTLRDAIRLCAEASLPQMLFAPLRRAVSAAAYYRGYRHGLRRLARGNEDADHGQRIVLNSRGEGLTDQAALRRPGKRSSAL